MRTPKDAPNKAPAVIKAEELIALKAPGQALAQLRVDEDANGTPTAIVIFLQTKA